MKTIVGFALLFCVASAVGKPARPQDIPKCLEGAWYEFAAKNEACSNKIMEIFQNQKVQVLYVYRHPESTLINVILPFKVNDSYIGSLCASACAKEANDYMKDKCGVMSLADVCKSIHLYL